MELLNFFENSITRFLPLAVRSVWESSVYTLYITKIRIFKKKVGIQILSLSDIKKLKRIILRMVISSQF